MTSLSSRRAVGLHQTAAAARSAASPPTTSRIPPTSTAGSSTKPPEEASEGVPRLEPGGVSEDARHHASARAVPVCRPGIGRVPRRRHGVEYRYPGEYPTVPIAAAKESVERPLIDPVTKWKASNADMAVTAYLNRETGDLCTIQEEEAVLAEDLAPPAYEVRHPSEAPRRRGSRCTTGASSV